jgi:hypothetical protein
MFSEQRQTDAMPHVTLPPSRRHGSISGSYGGRPHFPFGLTSIESSGLALTAPAATKQQRVNLAGHR